MAPSRDDFGERFWSVCTSGKGLVAVWAPSWAALGRSWSDLGARLTFKTILINFSADFRCQKGGILAPKTDQKSIQNRGANLRRKKGPLGSDLERFQIILEGRLGTKIIDFPFVFKAFRENCHFCCRSMSKSDPGAKKAPKGRQNCSQKGSQIDQKTDRNFDRDL